MCVSPACCASHTVASAERQRSREEPGCQGCGFNAKHPQAPKADTVAGSQVRAAGAQGESTSCRRVFGWCCGRGAAGSAGCVPRRRRTCRKARASRREGEEEKVRQCLELTDSLPCRNTEGSCYPVAHRGQAHTAEGKHCHLRPGLHSRG